MTKIALLGGGRTGGKVVDVAGSNHEVTVFDIDNQPTVDALKAHDVVICFLPGPILLEYIDMLVESGVPVVTGSTGHEWPEGFDQRLKDAGIIWVTASNFSLGMNLARKMIEVLGKTSRIFDDEEYGFALHEVHHKHKKDRPSGTALSWVEWLGLEADVSSGRVGDVVGDHKLTLEIPYEQISLQHVASDRKVFAQGAVWTAKRVLDGSVEPGLNDLAAIMDKELGL